MTQDTWINLVLWLGCTGFFAWRGYNRGVIHSTKGLLSVLSAYVVSYFLVGIVADFLQKFFTLPTPLSYLFAILILFFGTSILVRYLVGVYTKRLELQDEEQEFERELARVPGAVIGCAIGCILGVILVWFSGIMMDTVQLKQKGVQSFSDRQVDPLRKIAGNVVGGAVGFVVAQKTGENSLAPTMVAKLISDPVDTSQQLSQLKNSDDVKRIQSDPRFIALSQKPEFQALRDHPTPTALLTSPVLKELTEIIFSQSHSSAVTHENASSATPQEQKFDAVKKTEWENVKEEPTEASSDQSSNDDGHTIYRWTDEQGVKHFAQKKPEGNYSLEVIKTP